MPQSHDPQSPTDSNGFKWADLVLKLLAILVIPLFSYVLVQVDAVAKSTERVTDAVRVIEATRFSRDDGYELEARMRNEIRQGFDEIKDCLNRIQQGRQCD